MTDRLNVPDVLEAIQSGACDAGLDEIRTALDERRSMVASRTAHRLEPGDHVTLTGLSPKYVNGKTATVVEVKRTRVAVSFASTIGRFRAGKPILVPLTNVRPA